ncbi:MAG: hypothetical protein JWM16_472 [Verrucomicrobiales bacterium]|nr:hypothetical protein [Verrucomicrobiales bacterium]
MVHPLGEEKLANPNEIGSVAESEAFDVTQFAARKSRPDRLNGRTSKSHSLPHSKETPTRKNDDALAMSWDSSRTWKLYDETSRRLGIFERLAREDRHLEAARDFANYIQWSGLADFFTYHSRDGVLPINGPLLRQRAKDLESYVQDKWRKGVKERSETPQGKQGSPEPSLDAVNRKLDLIAGAVAKLLSK